MMIERMASELGLPQTFIYKVARGASHAYKIYSIPKRTGGSRTIHHPSRILKALQRWLLRNVIEHLPVHSAATAYIKGRSIMDNAQVHAASRYLLRMDLTNFFPSITQVDVARYIADHRVFFSDWNSADIDAFCSIVCRNSALTIGAPTSPTLSNAICYEMDTLLQSLSVRDHTFYTRYADDLFFSTAHRDVLGQMEFTVTEIVHNLSLPANLRINAAKTRHSSKRGARRVTGIILGSDGVAYDGRAYKRRIRSLIHKMDSLDPAARSSLAGMIAYLIGLDPQFKNSLIEKYGLPKVRRAIGGAD
jgi:RNA-directed DNA polymerase